MGLSQQSLGSGDCPLLSPTLLVLGSGGQEPPGEPGQSSAGDTDFLRSEKGSPERLSPTEVGETALLRAETTLKQHHPTLAVARLLSLSPTVPVPSPARAAPASA